MKQLDFMLEYVQSLFPNTAITLISSGAGNAYINLIENASKYKRVLIYPEISRIWNLLSEEEKNFEYIDTYLLFSKYEWAEEEFLKLGNVFNRCSGFRVNLKYLASLSNTASFKQNVLEDPDVLCITNETAGKGNIVLTDKSFLLMSAKLRDKVIEQLKTLI